MTYIQHYDAPLGRILLAADEVGLTGLWFDGAKYFADGLSAEHTERKRRSFPRPGAGWTFTLRAGAGLSAAAAPGWLDVSAGGGAAAANTHGQTVTYGELARQLAESRKARMSAQAVGGAVGHNKISIIIPCHRVVGTGGSLTGYAGGIDRR